MKPGFLFLLAMLFNSCATVTGTYIAVTSLSLDLPQFAKGFELRKNGETYILRYDSSPVRAEAEHLTGTTYGYAGFASMDARNLVQLCHGDALPTLIKQDLVLETKSSRKFDSGNRIDFKSVGCAESPLFKIVDSGRVKTPAKIGLVASSAAADGAIFYFYPLVYTSVVLGGAAVSVLALLLIASGMH